MEDLYKARAYADETPADVVAQTDYRVTVGEAPEGVTTVNSVQEAGRQRRHVVAKHLRPVCDRAVLESMDLRD